jgi:cytochrome c
MGRPGRGVGDVSCVAPGRRGPGHPQSTTAGCTGTIQTTVPEGHDPGDITVVFVAEYTDAGGLTGSDQVVLRQNR